jgi:hypothetical protein
MDIGQSTMDIGQSTMDIGQSTMDNLLWIIYYG